MSSERLEDKDLRDIIAEEADIHVDEQKEKHVIAGCKLPSEEVLEQWRTFRRLESLEFAIAVLEDIEELCRRDLEIEQQI
jgi:5'-deoxynucleotidase YfbR-like HD superfamily hydrolase